jgi:hypothetical protein
MIRPYIGSKPIFAGLENTKPKSVSFALYPNPASGEVTVKIPEGLNSKSWVEVLSIEGKLVISSPLTDDETHLKLGPLAKGIYLVKVVQNGKMSEVQKLIVK